MIDFKNRTWHIVVRDDSVTIYYTKKDQPEHRLIYEAYENESGDFPTFAPKLFDLLVESKKHYIAGDNNG